MATEIEGVPVGTAKEPGKAVSVGSSTTDVLAANAQRYGATFVNDSDEDIYLRLGATAVMNEGIRLNAAGGSFTIDAGFLYTGLVTAICSSGTKDLLVTEIDSVEGA